MKLPTEYHDTVCGRCGGRGKNKAFNPAWLKWARKQAGVSFRTLGEYVGFSPPYLHDIEHGRRPCPERVVTGLKRLLAKRINETATPPRAARNVSPAGHTQ